MNLSEKTTPSQQLENALNRSLQYEDDATELKRAQSLEALRLRDSQNQVLGKDLTCSQKSAAIALKQSQKDSAVALEAAHKDHEERLKRFQKTERESLRTKNQMISWLTGGYSNSDNEEKDSR